MAWKRISKISKEWVIVLSTYEKRSLLRFLLIYLGSIYTFICVLAWMFYTIEIKNLQENHALKMQNLASSVTTRIVTAHMSHEETLLHCLESLPIEKCFVLPPHYSLGLFDAHQKPLHVSFDEPVDFNQKFYRLNDSFYYVDESAQGHLGIHFTVVKQQAILETLTQLRYQVLGYLALSLLFATALGFVLAKLFLKPIQQEIRTLDTFIKDSTHELNTPITAILMSIQTLKNVDEKKRKRIELSAKRIATLYGNLSYMLLHDKQHEEKTDVDIKRLLEERIDYFADVIEVQHIKLHLDLLPISLHVNEESITKLFDNLLSNAIKYNRPHGSITITLTPDYLQIQDSGIGIAKDKLGEITQRYKRANRAKGGFGIGLSIVQTVCTTYHFRLEIDSREKEGSTFTVWF